MTSGSDHFRDELQDLLDDRLDAEARARVEEHLSGCEQCRRALQSLRWTRQVVRRSSIPGKAPADLPADIARVLDAEDHRAAAEAAGRPRGFPRWSRVAAAGLVALGLLLTLLYWPRTPALPALVARDYAGYLSGAVPLQFHTGDSKQAEEFFARGGLDFPVRVFDLAMMNYRLIGGRIHTLSDRNSAFYVYRGNGAKTLVCQMYQGDVAELPQASSIRHHNGIRFQIYQEKNLTLVFWQEGSVTCVLASDIAAEEVIQLAFAKSIRI